MTSHRRRFEEALADCDRAVEIEPKNSWNRFKRGVMRLRLDDSEEAEQDFLAALESVLDQINEEPPEIYRHFERVIYSLALDRSEAARQLLEEVFEGEPPLGDVQEFLRDLDDIAEVAGIDHEYRQELVRIAEEHCDRRRVERER